MNTRRGWTLIEILVALAVTALVAAALVSLFVLVTGADRASRARLDDGAALSRALDTLAADFTMLMACDAQDAHCALLLQPEEGVSQPFQLSFCQLTSHPEQADPRWATVTHVTYRLQPAGRHPPVLERLTRDLSGPEAWPPPVTNILLRGLREWRVECFDGQVWQTTWPASEEVTAPRAARVTALMEQGGTLPVIREVWIPVGTPCSTERERLP